MFTNTCKYTGGRKDIHINICMSVSVWVERARLCVELKVEPQKFLPLIFSLSSHIYIFPKTSEYINIYILIFFQSIEVSASLTYIFTHGVPNKNVKMVPDRKWNFAFLQVPQK